MSVQSIMWADDDESMGVLEFVAIVEFATSNASVMVLEVTKTADFSEKLATKESERSKFDASMMLSLSMNSLQTQN